MENISSSSSTMTSSISQSRQAIKYVALAQDLDIQDDNSEKAVSAKKRPPILGRLSSPVFPASAPSTVTEWTPYAYTPDSSSRSQPVTPALSFIRNSNSAHRSSHSRSAQSPSTASDMLEILRPWTPLVLYALTSLAFVVAIALYRDELFTFLDELSLWLRADEQYGHAILFSLIFLTTIPPIPLYSTLIVLSGYTFGLWTGAIISYFAALFGAVSVFVVSRSLFRNAIGRWLASCGTIKRVVRAIEKRPKLLFLIRLAPYPYNVMNCLLAASPTLTLHTYTVCTALSLFKVVIHTSIGASIHSFKEYHQAAKSKSKSDQEDDTHTLARVSTIVGVLLCLLILVYLSIVARRAVDEELDDEDEDTLEGSEERIAFLADPESAMGSAYPSSLPVPTSSSDDSGGRPMVQILREGVIPYRSSFAGDRDPSWS